MGEDDTAGRASDLIGLIYDAAIEPGLWLDALEQTCAFVRCALGTLYSHDLASGEPIFHTQWGHDPHYTKIYIEEFAPTNPLIPAHMAADAGNVLVALRMPIWDNFVRSSFFQEWGRPQGFLDTLSAIIERAPSRLSMVSLIRHEREGLVDDISFQRMVLLRPHFLRAIRIGDALEQRSVQVNALADSLDGLTAAVFIVDHKGALTYCNASGSQLLEEANVLRRVGGRIEAAAKASNRTLSTALVQLRAGWSKAQRPPAIAIETATGQRYFAHVLPLTAGLRRKAGLAYAGSAAIFVVKAAIDVSTATDFICRTYGLTTMELRVLRAVVEIGGVVEIAAALGISQETARTHLRHLFDKTAARSQIELVKMVAAHVPPLRV